MSTFTEFNGPGHAFGPSTKDITGLINAYTTLKNSLDAHINDTLETNNAHRGRDALDEAKRDIANSIAQVTARLTALDTGKADKPESGHYVTSTEAQGFATQAGLESALEQYYTKSGMDSMLGGYVTSDALQALTAVIDRNRALFEEFADRFELDENDSLSAACKGVLSAGQYLLGTLHVRKVIDFTEWQTVSMQFAGTGAIADTGTNGLYVIGRLSGDWSNDSHAPTENIFKAARAYVKYENGSPFDAIIDMVVTKSRGVYTGAMNAVVSKQAGAWNNLKFHLVFATAYDGEEYVYLCVSADGLAKDNSNYANWYVHACGINFIPLDDVQVARVTRVDGCVASTGGLKENQTGGIISSSITVADLSLDIIRDSSGNIMLQMQHVVDELGVEHRHLLIGDKKIESIQLWRRPVLISENEEDPEHSVVSDQFATVSDIQNLAGVPVGAYLFWPLYEEIIENGMVVERRAIDYPDTYAPLMRQTLTTAEYPELARALHHENDIDFQLPLIDCAIMKVKADAPDTIAPERVTVLNYNQIITLLTATSQNLRAEVDRSTAKDTEHDDAIAAEITRATDAETALGTAITDEVTRAQAAEQANADAIAAETTRAQAAEGALSDRIDATDVNVQANADAIAAEATRATAAEQANADAIAAETTRAQAAEQALSGRVSTNENDIADLDTAIHDETQRAHGVENNLTGRMDTAEDRLDAAEDRLTTAETAITDEATIRDLEDRMIQEVIDGKHPPASSVNWKRWAIPTDVETLPATTDGFEVGDRIYVTSTNQKYYVDSNNQWSQTGITTPTGRWF